VVVACQFQASGGDQCVVEAGGDGERDGDIERNVAAGDDPGVAPWQVGDLAEQYHADGDDLTEAVCLAEQGRVEVAQGGGVVEDPCDEEHADIAAEDDGGDAWLEDSHPSEDEEERTEENLVGDGVKVLAEPGALAEEPSEQAIHGVGGSGDEEESKGERKAAFEDGDDQEGGQADAEHGQQIGSSEQRAHWSDTGKIEIGRISSRIHQQNVNAVSQELPRGSMGERRKRWMGSDWQGGWVAWLGLAKGGDCW